MSERRVVRLKSKGQEILELIKKNLPEDEYNYDSINSLLKIKGYSPGDGDSSFYATILKNTFYNQKISITDILGNKRFKFSFFISSKYKDCYRCFTNDKLYWISSIYNELKDSEVINALVVENAEFEIATLSTVQKGDIKQGFIQDFDKSLCFIGFKEYDKTKIESLKFENFTYNGKKYNYYIGNDGSRIVYDAEKYSFENLEKAYKKIKYIDSRSAKSNELKIKTIKTGEDELYYMCQKLKVTDYLPGVIIFSDPCFYTAYVEIEYDTMKLEELCNKYLGIKNYINSNYLIDELNIDIDELEMLITFLTAEARISGDNDRIKKVNDLAGDFVKQKNYYNDIKQCIKSNFKLLLKFYDSFVNRISLDVCDSLYKKFSAQKTDNEIFLTSDNIKNIKDLIITNDLGGACKHIVNILDSIDTIKEAIDKCIRVLGKVVSKSTMKLIEDFRAAGLAIYSMTSLGNDSMGIIRVVRSPTTFLGGVINGDVKVVEKAVKAVEVKFEKVEDVNEAHRQILYDIESSKYSNRDENIAKGLAAVLDTYNVYKVGKLISPGGEVNENAINFYEILKRDGSIGDSLGKNLNIIGIMVTKHGPEQGINIASTLELLKENKSEMDTISEMFKALIEKGEIAKEGEKAEIKIGGLKTGIKGEKENKEIEKRPAIKAPEKEGDGDTESTAPTVIPDTVPNLDLNSIVDKMGLKKRLDGEINNSTLAAYRKRGISDDVLYNYYITSGYKKYIPSWNEAKKNMGDIVAMRKETYRLYKGFFPEPVA